MSISIKLLIPIFLFSILLPSILNVKFPNKEYLEFVEEFTNIKKEEFSKFLNNSVFLRDLLTHIDQYIGDSKYLKTNPKHSQLRQARMEFWTNFREHYNLMQYRDLIGRALIVKGAKTEEIEYKLNRMKDKEALDILRDYYEYCQQKIKDIEKEMNEKANVGFGGLYPFSKNRYINSNQNLGFLISGIGYPFLYMYILFRRRKRKFFKFIVAEKLEILDAKK
ncbi:unnamed protein product [Meloidogyne enterolobii]|uniref:Uncharacterized protein n=1 Tax=Meloidogyne enterolobii TaxID=390850 RepID=A0ACB0YU29_MELEN